jgi:hypothetical protein
MPASPAEKANSQALVHKPQDTYTSFTTYTDSACTQNGEEFSSVPFDVCATLTGPYMWISQLPDGCQSASSQGSSVSHETSC